MDKKREQSKEISKCVYDRRLNAGYIKGKFMETGGFARCYELINTKIIESFTGKIVSKTFFTNHNQREKMAPEVEIHLRLSHPNVVRLVNCFDDNHNGYIILEHCSRHSLMELHKRRKIVTEPEARYFLQHICLGLDYLHDKKIIHRDLKLGNVFIKQMVLKLGNFSLATTVRDGERRRTHCGIPNYIAPEVLSKSGHSFEMDVWAVGCILYTLLFGRCPFVTKTLEDAYERIRLNKYTIPSFSSPSVSELITRLLAADFKQRPTMKQVMKHNFFTDGFMPKRLPLSCLTMSPKFNNESIIEFISSSSVRSNGNNGMEEHNHNNENNGNKAVNHPKDFYISELQKQLEKVCNARVFSRSLSRDNDESPECIPIFWVSRWVDFSYKYGLGYELCDNSTGMMFNDRTRLILDNAANELTYIEKNDVEYYHTMQIYPKELHKKVSILNHIKLHYLNTLTKTRSVIDKKDDDDLARLPVLRNWFRYQNVMVLHLSNGTLQINCFKDHTKLIICPLLSAVTYIDQQKEFHVYKMSHLLKNGCPRELHNMLNYAKLMVEKLIAMEKTRIGS